MERRHPLEFISHPLPGIVEIIPKRWEDDRGYFAETFREDLFTAHCGAIRFVQDNESLSMREGTVRGLHFQTAPFEQGKLVRCTAGRLFDVMVDIRAGSESFGQWFGLELSAARGNQVWIPAGFAHGFCALEPATVISYKVTNFYSRDNDAGLAWDDPAIGIVWPDLADAETLSPKDRVQPRLAELPPLFTSGT